jgi:hypothetical protein
MSVAIVGKRVLVVVASAWLLSGSAIAQQYHRTDLTANASSVSPSTPKIIPTPIWSTPGDWPGAHLSLGGWPIMELVSPPCITPAECLNPSW